MPDRDQHSAVPAESLWWILNQQALRVRGDSLRPPACFITASHISTKPDIRRLSRRWTTMVQLWHFSKASDFSLSISVLLMYSVQLRHTSLYFSSAAGRRTYRLLIPWQFDKSNFVLQCCDETRVTGTGACHAFTVFFNRICFSIYRSTCSISQRCCNCFCSYKCHALSLRSVSAVSENYISFILFGSSVCVWKEICMLWASEF